MLLAARMGLIADGDDDAVDDGDDADDDDADADADADDDAVENDDDADAANKGALFSPLSSK